MFSGARVTTYVLKCVSTCFMCVQVFLFLGFMCASTHVYAYAQGNSTHMNAQSKYLSKDTDRIVKYV